MKHSTWWLRALRSPNRSEFFHIHSDGVHEMEAAAGLLVCATCGEPVPAAAEIIELKLPGGPGVPEEVWRLPRPA